jgi:hypothetical protein
MAPNKIDAGGKWGKMLSKEEWETFKKESPEYKEYLKNVPTESL